MWFVLSSLIAAFVVGLIARALVRGPGPTGCLPTTVLGLVGSFVGGFLGYVLFRNDSNDGAFQASGIIGSIIGSVIALLVYRAATGRRSLRS